MHKVGVQSGLKFRLTEQDNTILEMKNEHLNMHMSNQQLIKEVETFRSQYQEQLNATNNLKRDLVMRDELIEKMRMELNTLSSLKENEVEILFTFLNIDFTFNVKAISRMCCQKY